MATKKKMFKVSPKASADKKPDIIAYVSDNEILLCIAKKEKVMIKHWFSDRDINDYDRVEVNGVIHLLSGIDFYSEEC